MNYIKSFWTSDPTTSNDNSQQQQPYNSVTFTTQTSGNSFVITTTSQVPQRPQQLVFHTNSSSLKPEMTVSPTDSFHSTSSTFDRPIEKKSKGNDNNGFNGSTSEINSTHHHHHHHHHVHPNSQVVHREQYWTWQWPFTTFWEDWNNREKIFLIVIVVLSLCIVILLSVLSVVLVRNFQMRQLILNRLGESLSIM